MTLRTDPERHRAWQERSRERAAERARKNKRKPMSRGAGPARRKAVKKRRPDRAAKKFLRNFGSVAYVDATRRAPCVFCQQNDGTVRTAHLLEARKAGGCGGGVKKTGPACFACDEAWGQGSGRTPSREQFLRRMGLTWTMLVRRIREHHSKYGHLYESRSDEH